MNWNPTAYPGGTSLKPIKIDLIWVLTEHTIKDLLASLTILYCVGRDLMAAPFSSANFGSGCLKIIFFYFPGLLLSHLTSKWLEQLVFFRTSSDWGVPSVCFPSSGKRVGGWEEGAGDQAEKKGFRFNRQTIPMSLRKQSLCQQWLPQ